MPVATGSGRAYMVEISTAITSGSVTIKAPDAAGTFEGQAFMAPVAGGAVQGFNTVAATDTITLNGSTLGGQSGDIVYLRDVAPNKFQVEVFAGTTGTAATLSLLQ